MTMQVYRQIRFIPSLQDKGLKYNQEALFPVGKPVVH